MPAPSPSPTGLSLGWRRLIACVGILAFLGVYIFGVITIGAMIEDKGALAMIFYAVAGLLWGLPVLPIISWSEAYKRKPKP